MIDIKKYFENWFETHGIGFVEKTVKYDDCDGIKFSFHDDDNLSFFEICITPCESDTTYRLYSGAVDDSDVIVEFYRNTQFIMVVNGAYFENVKSCFESWFE